MNDIDQSLYQKIKHIAIIMDGNGRWARAQCMPRLFGHRTGAERVREIVTHCAKRGLPTLTLYAFSSENWSRPVSEVTGIMRLLHRYIHDERHTLHKNNIRLKVIGNLKKIPDQTRQGLEDTQNFLKDNTGLVLNIALSYGGREELVDVAKQLARMVKQNELDPEEITENIFEQHLWTSGLSDPDLLIRTSGEQRLSNFLPWQSVYTEMYFTKVHWPEFTTQDLDLAVDDFLKRKRRFGQVEEYPVMKKSSGFMANRPIV